MNALEKAKQLIAGRVEYDDLCRYATHNLNERQAIYVELSERGISDIRRDFLKRSLKALNIEKGLLEAKEARIKPHVTSECLFII